MNQQTKTNGLQIQEFASLHGGKTTVESTKRFMPDGSCAILWIRKDGAPGLRRLLQTPRYFVQVFAKDGSEILPETELNHSLKDARAPAQPVEIKFDDSGLLMSVQGGMLEGIFLRLDFTGETVSIKLDAPASTIPAPQAVEDAKKINPWFLLNLPNIRMGS